MEWHITEASPDSEVVQMAIYTISLIALARCEILERVQTRGRNSLMGLAPRILLPGHGVFEDSGPECNKVGQIVSIRVLSCLGRSGGNCYHLPCTLESSTSMITL